MYAKTTPLIIGELVHNLEQMAEEPEGREQRVTLRPDPRYDAMLERFKGSSGGL